MYNLTICFETGSLCSHKSGQTSFLAVFKEAFTALTEASTYFQFLQQHNCPWWYSLLPYRVSSLRCLSSWHLLCFYDTLAGHSGFDLFVIAYSWWPWNLLGWCSHTDKTYGTWRILCIWFSINWLPDNSPGSILLLQASSGKKLDALHEWLCCSCLCM
jgi:hypothetical protein